MNSLQDFFNSTEFQINQALCFLQIIDKNCEIVLKSYEIFDCLINKKVTIYMISIVNSYTNQIMIRITKEDFEKLKNYGFREIKV